MKSILIRHKVVIPGIQIVGTPNLTFHKWLPLNEPIESDEENMAVKIWLDNSNTIHGPDIDIFKRTNVLVESVYVDITLKKVEENLIDLIKEKRVPNEEEKEALSDLGEQVYSTVTTKINRLIDWANSVKQQYWLTNILVDFGQILPFNIEAEAKAIVLPEANNNWFNWQPITSQHIHIVATTKESYITPNDWPKLRDYINSEKRTIFKFELISRAFTLNGSSLRTNALIDAVTALEIAVSDFVRSPSIDCRTYENLLCRIDIKHLKAAYDHLGFSTFIQYLLPLIFDEETIENADIIIIAEALQTRNNIVHNGQRDIVESKSIKYLVSIRKLIKILDKYSS